MTMRLTSCLYAVVAFLVYQGVLQAQEKVFFEKVLLDKRKIIVLRKPFAYRAPSKEEEAKLAKQFPGTSPSDAKPESSNEYLLFVIEKGSKSRVLLWKKKVVEFTAFGMRDPSFKIYDASIKAGTLTVIYRVSSFVIADIANRPFPYVEQRIEAKNVLVQEGVTELGEITSAVIDNVLSEQKEPMVLLKGSSGSSYLFLWQNGRWIVQRTEKAKLLFTTPYTLNGKKWQLSLTVDPTASGTEIIEGGRESVHKGTSATLQQLSPLADEKVDSPNVVALRQMLAIFNPNDPPQFWSGDAVVDEKTRKAYIALADGSKFWIEVIDLDTVQKQSQAVRSAAEPTIDRLVNNKNILIGPDKTMSKTLPFITAIALRKVGNDLFVEFNSKKQESQWSYSLSGKRWSQTFS